MAECVAPGWGTGPYGKSPWAGSLSAIPGGHIPVSPPFDVYCVGPCGPMSVFDTYLEVDSNSPPGQAVVVPGADDYRLFSGMDSAHTGTAWNLIDITVPVNWTMEFTFYVTALPNDFSRISERHIFLGTIDQQGVSAGLFFSKAGVGYTGNVVHDSDGTLELNTVFQVIPGSLGAITEGAYYTVRLAVEFATKTTFVYLTETIDLPTTGHQLLAILPAILSSSGAVGQADGTVISVKGVVGQPSDMQLNSLCLGSGLLIPNLPPVANAGRDQAAQTCSIVRLDGSGSFDPEGSPVTYHWRLIDAPLPSSFAVDVDDGITVSPTPFTNKLYSEKLGTFHELTGIVAGDVILAAGIPYDVVDVGSDGSGFFVHVSEYALPAPRSGQLVKLLRQAPISGRTEVKPTFYPDVPGIYTFDLTVFDGGYLSEPSRMIINVTESPVPRGVTPDLSFLWGYLLDSWNLVEGKEVISTFWSALAQVTATELLTLWQHEYSKSLRDIPRTFQRRWLHYDLYVPEPVIDQTTTRVVWGGVEGLSFTTLPVAGESIWVESPLFDTTEIVFSGTNPMIPEKLAAQLQLQLRRLDKRFEVQVKQSGTDRRLLVLAPFVFAFTADSTASGLFSYPVFHDVPQGTSGAAVGLQSYKVERGLGSLDIQQGDQLVVDGVAYGIVSLGTDPGDAWPKQRIIVDSPLPIGTGKSWSISGVTKSVFLDFYAALVSEGDIAVFEVVDKKSGQLDYSPAIVRSAATSGLIVEISTLAAFLSQPDLFDVFFYAVFRRTYMPVDPLVVGVPYLQEKIVSTNDQEVLRQNIDFLVETFRGKPCLRFVTPSASRPGTQDIWEGQIPPKRLWAETTYVDNRPVIEQNFGLAAEFSLTDLASLDTNLDYLSAVRGLWYAYFNGPTMRNLRVGAQILLGLPFAEETGTIREISETFSPNQGRILIEDQVSAAIVRSYEYPRGLLLEENPLTGKPYAVGDLVSQFSPLVTGVEVVDYIKDPSWFQVYLNQGLLFEVEKFHKFLVRVDSKAFSLSTLLFVKSFILRIRPQYTFPLFLVLAEMADDTTVSTSDEVEYGGTLYLNDGITMIQVDGQGRNLGGSFDDPRAATGGWENRFDGNFPFEVPTFPDPITPTYWGFDKNLLVPTDLIYGEAQMTLDGATLPTFDSIFAFDTIVLNDHRVLFEDRVFELRALSASPQKIGLTQTAPVDITANVLVMDIKTIGGFPGATLRFHLYVNGTIVQTVDTVLLPGIDYRMTLPLTPVTIHTGDTVAVGVTTTTGALPVPWSLFFLQVGEGITWAYDVDPPAGNYRSAKVM